MQQPFSLEVGQATDPGQVRDGNEDSIIITPLNFAAGSSRGLFVAVADGMGGHAAGEVASRVAAEASQEAYYTSSFTDLETSLRAAFRIANERVHEVASEGGKAGMGTTLTAAVILGDRLVVGHVGDSRAYLIRGDLVGQLTTDHSWVQQQVQTGGMTPEEARDHPNRNVITRALGHNPFVEVDVIPETLEPGDWVMLCTDGLSNVVREDELVGVLNGTRPQAAADQLLAMANQRGAPDNASVVLLYLRPATAAGGATPPRPAASGAAGGRATARQRTAKGGTGIPVWVLGVLLVLALVLFAAGAYALGLGPFQTGTLTGGPTPIPPATVGSGTTTASTPPTAVVVPTPAIVATVALTVAPPASPTVANTVAPTVAEPTAPPVAGGTPIEGMDPTFAAFPTALTFQTLETGACAREAPKTDGQPCPPERLVYERTVIVILGEGKGEAITLEDGTTNDVWYYGEATMDEGARVVRGYVSAVAVFEVVITAPAEGETPTEPAAEGEAPAEDAAATATPAP